MVNNMNYLDIQFRTSPDFFQQSVAFRLYEKKDGKYKFVHYELVLGENTRFRGFLCNNNKNLESFLLKLNLNNVIQSFLDKINLFYHHVQFCEASFRYSFNRIKNELMYELKRDIDYNYLIKIISETYHDDFLMLRQKIDFFKYEKFNVIRLIDSLLESFYVHHINTK